MKKLQLTFLFLAAFLVAMPLTAQTDPHESGWKILGFEGYSGVTDAQTNNGSLSYLRFRIGQHLSLRTESLVLLNPARTQSFAKLQWNVGIGHLLKSSQFANADKYELFVDGGAGPSNLGVKSTGFKLAASLGGGLEYHLTDKITIAPLDVSWVVGPGFNGVIGNHLQYLAGIGFKIR